MQQSDIQSRRQEFDPGDMWGAVARFGDQLEDANRIALPDPATIDAGKISNIVFCGMGGSAIGGDLLSAYFRRNLSVPMMVNRDYQLPGFVGERTLLIFSSYSGNTEETLSAFDEGRNSGAQIIGISSNGKLGSEFHRSGIPWIEIPGGYQPRAALGYSFLPMARLFTTIGLVEHSLENDIEETIEVVRDISAICEQQNGNQPLSIARDLVGSVPMIYTAPELSVAGVRLKGQVAENAQMLGFTNALPELNHNEIVGWDRQPELLSQLVLLWMVDTEMHPKIRRRVEVTTKLLQDYPRAIHTLQPRGVSWMARLLSLIHLGDWISVYAALLQGVDPTPVQRIDLLKERLAG